MSDSAYSSEAFENSRFDHGEEVEVLLRDPKHGGVMSRATGTCAARNEDVEFETPDGEERVKTLVWVKDMEGYEKPHPNIPGKTKEVDEAWFAEEALRKKGGDVLDNISFN